MIYSLVAEGNAILVNGIPYQKGDLAIDEHQFQATGITVLHKMLRKQPPLIKNIPYNEIYTDVAGTTPFASFSALRSFIIENFFFELGGGGTGQSDAYYKRIKIADPAWVTHSDLGSVTLTLLAFSVETDQQVFHYATDNTNARIEDLQDKPNNRIDISGFPGFGVDDYIYLFGNYD